MQDRFKFRVWVKDQEEYIQDEAGECHIMHSGELICGDWVDDGYCGHYDYFNDDEVIIEQCTGLKDNNGKLIYEGDILAHQFFDNSEVKWNEYCACFMVVFNDGDNREFSEINTMETEIIGNIHENADLLENKDE